MARLPAQAGSHRESAITADRFVSVPHPRAQQLSIACGRPDLEPTIGSEFHSRFGEKNVCTLRKLQVAIRRVQIARSLKTLQEINSVIFEVVASRT